MSNELVATALRYIHIGFGLIGILALWIPVFSKKGSLTHIRGGKVFEWCCYLVGSTGIVTSVWWLVIPLSRPELAGKSAEELASITGDVNFLFGLLLFLGFVLLSTTRFGVRVVRIRERRDGLDNWETIAWASCLAMASLVLAGSSVGQILENGMLSRHTIFLLFPLIAFADVRSKWRFAKSPNAVRGSTLQQHINCMTGSAITFCTAFLVFGGNRIYGHFLPEGLLIASFFVPTIVGFTLSKLASRSLVARYESTCRQAASMSGTSRT